MIPWLAVVILCCHAVNVSTQEGSSCASEPCQNGALCEDTDTGYRCFCVDGYLGERCQIDFDDCSSSPCRNNATCVDGIASYTCLCHEGYAGSNCQVNIDECVSGPCPRNSTCVDLVNGYLCNCAPPYRGDKCSVLPCDVSPCQNEAVCRNDVHFTESLTGFVCDCITGFEGPRCETNLEDCDFENFTSCSGNGLCLDGISMYSCLCEPGWVGERCHSPVDDCIGNSCKNNATCSDQHLGYLCTCQTGYDGALCERERDECALWNPCENGATCVDLFNAYRCECSPGWFGVNCTEEVNECESNACFNGAQCIDVIGGYLCRCQPFYTGLLCETQYNPCAAEYNPCMNGANCVVPPDGKYRCFCLKGYTGIQCEININECLSMPCINNSTCEDITAGYICHCMVGWQGQQCQYNIDDCASKPCSNGANCTDLLNGYACNCTRNYQGPTCDQPVDFCQPAPCYHEGTCVGHIGGYTCICSPPYTGDRCQDRIDACYSSPCINNGTCFNTNTQPGYYSCSCPSPFTGKTCMSIIDFCASEPCLYDGTCVSLDEDYFCVCPQYLTGKQCEDLVDFCRGSPCKSDANCINEETDFRCICAYGFTGRTCTEMIDFCVEEPCQNNASCLNIRGGFLCKCLGGFVGDLCQNILPNIISSSSLSIRSSLSSMYLKSSSLLSISQTSSLSSLHLQSSSLLAISHTVTFSSLHLQSSSVLAFSQTPTLSSKYLDIYTKVLISESNFSSDTILTSPSYQSTSESSFNIFSPTTNIPNKPISSLARIPSRNDSVLSLTHIMASTTQDLFSPSTWTSETIHSFLSFSVTSVQNSDISPTSSKLYNSSSTVSQSSLVTSLSSMLPSEFLKTFTSTSVISSVLYTFFSISSSNYFSPLTVTKDIISSTSPSLLSSTPINAVTIHSETSSVHLVSSRTSMPTSILHTSDIFSTAVSKTYNDKSGELSLFSSQTSSAPSHPSFRSSFQVSSFFTTPISMISSTNDTAELVTYLKSSTVDSSKLSTFPVHFSFLSFSFSVSSVSPHSVKTGAKNTVGSSTTPFINFSSTSTYNQTSIGSYLGLTNLLNSTMSALVTSNNLSQSDYVSSKTARASMSSTITAEAISTLSTSILSIYSAQDTSQYSFVFSLTPSSMTFLSKSSTVYSHFSTRTEYQIFNTITISSSFLQSTHTETNDNQLNTTVHTSAKYITNILQSLTFHTNDTSSDLKTYIVSGTHSSSTHSSETLTSVLNTATLYSGSSSVLESNFSSTLFKLPNTTSSKNVVSSLSVYTSQSQTSSLVFQTKSSMTSVEITKSLLPSFNLLTSSKETFYSSASAQTVLSSSFTVNSTNDQTGRSQQTSSFLSSLVLSSTLNITSDSKSFVSNISSSELMSIEMSFTHMSLSSSLSVHVSTHYLSLESVKSSFENITPSRTVRLLSSTGYVGTESTPLFEISKLYSSVYLESVFGRHSSVSLSSSITSTFAHSITSSFVLPMNVPSVSSIDSTTYIPYITKSLSNVLSSSALSLSLETFKSSFEQSSSFTERPRSSKKTSSLVTTSLTGNILSINNTQSAFVTKSTVSQTLTSLQLSIQSGVILPLLTSTSTMMSFNDGSPITIVTSFSTKTSIVTSSSLYSLSVTKSDYITTAAPALTCVNFLCLNGGICKDDRSGIFCDCQENFIGKYCQTEASACDGYLCENGGKCVVVLGAFDTQIPRCDCLFPYSGTHCEDEKLIYYPTFSGSSYMQFTPPTITADQSNEIYISIKTTQRDGAVFYAANEIANYKEAAFIVLYLTNGKLRYKFSCDGAMLGIVEVDVNVNTGDIYNIIIRQVWAASLADWCSASVQISGKSFVSKPLLTLANPQLLGALFLGGIPRYSLSPGGLSDVSVVSGFIGCIHDVQINQIELNLVKSAVGGRNIENCNVPVCQYNPCTNGATCHSAGEDWYCNCPPEFGGALCERKLCDVNPCLHGGTCIILEDEHDQLCLCAYGRGGVICQEALTITLPQLFGNQFGYSSYFAYDHPHFIEEDFEIELSFSIENSSLDSSLILFLGNTGSRRDYTAFGIQHSFVIFKFDLGSGDAQIFSAEALNTKLKQHVVRFGRRGRDGWLQLDYQRNVTGRSPGELTALNTNSKMFVGGIEVSDIGLLPSGAKFENSFRGCIYDLKIKNSITEFLAPGRPPGYVIQGRNVGKCSSLSCDPNPCQNGAKCFDLGASLYCNCTEHWKGSFCLDEITVCDKAHSCAYGSTCIPSLPDGYKCLCGLGKRGMYCDQDIRITDPLFLGENSFMSFTPVYIKKQIDITMQIKARRLDGLLFYVAQRLHSNAGDFMSVILDKGIVEVRINMGSGVNILRNTDNLVEAKDGWHVIAIGRNLTHVNVSVDGRTTVAALRGMMSFLDTTTDFYLGGLPRLVDVTPEAFENEPVSFEGCIREFVVNGHYFDLSEKGASDGRNIVDCDNTSCGYNVCKNNGKCSLLVEGGFACNCTENFVGLTCEIPVQCANHACIHGECGAQRDASYVCDCVLGWKGLFCSEETAFNTSAEFSSESFIYLDDKLHESGNKYQTNISFEFSTLVTNGLIMWNGQTYSDDADYLGVGLQDGRLKLVWNLGWYSRDEVITTFKYNDGLWHHVNINRVNQSLVLNVDDNVYKSQVSGDFNHLDTNGQFYLGSFGVGGVPEYTFGNFKSSFAGCLKSLKIENNSIADFSKATSGRNILPCNRG